MYWVDRVFARASDSAASSGFPSFRFVAESLERRQLLSGATFAAIGDEISAIQAGTVDPDSQFLAASVTDVQPYALPPTTGNHLAWVVEPVDAVAGHRMVPIELEMLGATGNRIPSNSSVTLSLASGIGSGRTLGTARFVHGIARFTKLSLRTADTCSLEANDGNLTPLLSTKFTVSADRAYRMQLLSLAPDQIGHGLYDGELDIVDRYGNRVTSDQSTVKFRPIPRSNPEFLSVFPANSVYDGGQLQFINGDLPVRVSEVDYVPANGILTDSNRRVKPVRFHL